MNSNVPQNSVKSIAAAVWDNRWERFKMALTQDGVEPRFQDYYRGWVLGWLKFIKPKRFQEAECDDLTHFLTKLAAEGKKNWQGRQALEALKVFYQRVEPIGWGQHGFDVDLEKIFKERLEHTRPAEVARPPIRGAQDFAGRGDEGDLPAKYADFVAAVEEGLRTHRYAYRTEQSYLDWVRRFLIFAQPGTRREIRWDQVRKYLDYLTVVRRVAASTQNQALSALQFMFFQVLKKQAGGRENITRPAQSRRIPTVLTREEVKALTGEMEGTGRLMVELMYGAGLRVMECLRLRVKDIDFGNGYVVVRGGKGDKDCLSFT